MLPSIQIRVAANDELLADVDTGDPVLDLWRMREQVAASELGELSDVTATSLLLRLGQGEGHRAAGVLSHLEQSVPHARDVDVNRDDVGTWKSADKAAVTSLIHPDHDNTAHCRQPAYHRLPPPRIVTVGADGRTMRQQYLDGAHR